jgi:hypothetical protein
MTTKSNPALDPRFLAISEETGFDVLVVTGVAWGIAEWGANPDYYGSFRQFDLAAYAECSELPEADVAVIYEAIKDSFDIGFPRRAVSLGRKMYLHDDPENYEYFREYGPYDHHWGAIGEPLGLLAVAVAGMWWVLSQYMRHAEPGDWRIEEYAEFSGLDMEVIDELFMAFEDHGLIRWAGFSGEYYKARRKTRSDNDNGGPAESAA